MKNIGTIQNLELAVLNKAAAHKNAAALTTLIDQIPHVKYTQKEVLAETKGDRRLLGKWHHSLALFHENQPIAVIFGYERASEHNEQYPDNTLYISELAVDSAFQKRGLAKALFKAFLDYNRKVGFKYLEGSVSFSVQTNSADWNKYVVALYQSVGFTQRSTKHYDNRTDAVFGLI